MEKKKIIIGKELMKQAIDLSGEWNNVGYILLNDDGTLAPSVWNHYKWEDPKRKIVAYCEGSAGFVIEDEFKDDYEFEVDYKTLLN